MPVIKIRRKELTQEELEQLVERTIPKENLLVQIQVDGFAPTFYLLDKGQKIGTISSDLLEFDMWVNPIRSWVIIAAEKFERELNITVTITVPEPA